MSRLYSLMFALALVIGTGGAALADQPTGDQPDAPAGDTATAGDTTPDPPADTGSPDTGAADTGTADTGAADTGAADTGAADTSAADTGAPADPPPADPPPEAKKDDKPVAGLIPSASFFTRYELRENYEDIGKTAGRFSEFDLFVYRARLGLKTTPIDIGDGQNVVIRFVPQISGFWADRPGTLADNPLQLHEAVMRLSKGKWWVEAGRFEMTYGDHLVIGNVGWHETSRAFDGVRAHFPFGSKGAWLETFFTQVGEGLLDGYAGSLAEGDQIFLGAYLGLGPNFGKGTELDAYVLAHVWPATDDVAMTTDYGTSPEITVGGRYNKRSGNIDVRAEAGVQLGKRPAGMDNVSVFAFQGEAEVGFHASQDKLRLAAGGFYASGDDPDSETDESWNQLYPTAHKWLGLMDVMGGRSNVMGAMGKAKFKIDKKLAVGGQAHLFMRPQTPDGVDSYAGFELDTFVLKKLGKGLVTRAGYHIFLPNETGPLGNDKMVHYLELLLKFTLK